MSNKQHICAPGTNEHTLCGMAFDAFNSGACETPIVFAKPDETVTCPECKRQIDHVTNSFQKYKFTGY